LEISVQVYLLDWLNLLLRWAHVIVAIAWIGSSFYFVFLDNSLTKPEDPVLVDKGVSGELWAVHGGGFYHPQKYLTAPQKLPDHLHWFFWESYSTFLTGFSLFTVMYLFNASTFLIDKNVYAWSATAAIFAALGFLVIFWLIYDAISRSFGQKKNGDLIVGFAVSICVVLASWLACHLFSGRAGFLLVGAMMATTMSANVFFWIIPGQRTVVAQLRAGQPVDPIYGWRGKQRSVHNTYFTLPVLIAMLSNHYGWLYTANHNWAVIVLMMLAGALIRHSFVARHKALTLNKKVPWQYAGLGVLVLVCVIVWLAPAASLTSSQADSTTTATFAEIRAVVEQRCVMCHNAQLQNKNVALHTPELISKHAQQIYQQAVVLKQMPMNNATQITDNERLLIKHWFESGASAN
jgi:uncharacterized membrane protein